MFLAGTRQGCEQSLPSPQLREGVLAGLFEPSVLSHLQGDRQRLERALASWWPQRLQCPLTYLARQEGPGRDKQGGASRPVGSK